MLFVKKRLAPTEAEAAMEQRLAQLLNMANTIAERLTPEQKEFDINSELYDAGGLPK